jgi:hypothetical protein
LTKQPWFNSASRGNEYGLDNFFIQFFPSCPYRFGDRLSQVLRMAGFAEKGAIKSGVTSLAGFAGVRFPQKRGSRTTTPAAFR